MLYIFKLNDNPRNPVYDVVGYPKHLNLYASKAVAMNFLGIYWEQLLKEAKIDVEEIADDPI